MKPASDSEKVSSIRQWLVGCLWLLPLPAAWAYYFVYPQAHVTTCLFKIALGKDCIFCGLTRAFAAATHGQFEEASELNATWPLFMAILIVASCITLASAMGYHRARNLVASACGAIHLLIVAAIIVLSIAF